MLYLVSYDLVSPGQQYAGLTNAIQLLGGVRVLLSAWLVPSTLRAEALRDQLHLMQDTNDRLYVTEITRNSAWYHSLTDAGTSQRLFNSARD